VTASASPKMASASGMSGYPAYYDFTGCTGEGQVIAVIDSELDVTHPMFAALDESVEVKLTEQDIKEIADGIGFNVDIDPSLAYRSSKLPYVIDYCDDNPYEDVAINDTHPNGYHGTHVAGIAAGEPFTDADGKVVSGIAKDAQIVFMAAETAGSGFLDDSILAALEDAVKLHADVINMSFGGNGEDFDIVCKEAFAAAEKAGVTICLSAGNEDNGSIKYGEVHAAANPDTSMINHIVVPGAGFLTVASADNDHTVYKNTVSVGDEEIPYFGCVSSDNGAYVKQLSDTLSGEYEYVYCGEGMEADYAQHDLQGKIAVVDRTDFWLQNKAEFAAKAGAVAIIGIFPEGKTPFEALFDHTLPAAHISYEDGQKLLEASEKKMTIGETSKIGIAMPTAVSDFTSWGVGHTLELRPDIMGVGGNVESASYMSGTSEMSGTSMASPYLAGCTAVLEQYLEKKGIELEGAEKLRYIRNLMMTSAVPYVENDMFVTPRRQGAGLVSLNNVLEDKVLLTGKEGESKIQLRDKVGDDFSFELDQRNISEEDVTFKSARLVLTTDDSSLDEAMQMQIIDGQRTLNCTADLSKLLHIAAGEKRKETVSVSLDPAQTAEIGSIFTNGFFVEGYLLLEGADNCCDISVPLLGFHGDWEKLPILDPQATEPVISMGDAPSIAAGYSPAQLVGLVSEVMAQIPEEALADPEADPLTLFMRYATEEQYTKFLDSCGTAYVSPNGDGMAEDIGLNIMPVRFTQMNGLNIYDSDGKLLLEGEETNAERRYVPYFLQNMSGIGSLKDGTYTGQVDFSLNDGESQNAAQTEQFTFIVDTKKPEVTSEIREENGRTILKLTASDEALDGVYISGTGRGGVFGKYDPEADEAAADQLSLLPAAMELLHSDFNLQKDAFEASQLPLFAKIFTGTDNASDHDGITFSDVIAAEPDENGTFTLEYDITDLESYSVSVTDKAYNFTVIESEAAAADTIEPGLYQNDKYLYDFTGNTLIRVDLMNGTRTEYVYEAKDGKITLDGKPLTVKTLNPGKIRLIFDDGIVTVLDLVDSEGLGEKHFYTGEQIKKRTEELLTTEYPALSDLSSIVYYHNGLFTVKIKALWDETEEVAGDMVVDARTGDILDDAIGIEQLFPITFADLSNFIMSEVIDGQTYYYDLQTGVRTAQADRSETPFSFEIWNTKIAFTVDGVERTADYVMEGGSVSFAWDDGTKSVMYMETGSETFRFYDNAQLTEMAKDYSEAKDGIRPAEVKVEAAETGFVSLIVSEDEVYTVSPITAAGWDQNSEDVDLKEALEPMKDPFTSGVWFSWINGGSYIVMNGNQSGQMIMLDGSYQTDFTYTMTADGMLFNIGSGEHTYTDKAQLFPQEDGTILMVWSDGSLEYLSYLEGRKADTLQFFTTEELKEMADAHISGQAAEINTVANPDGTISVYVLDETHEPIDIFQVDPADGTGTDMENKPVDLKERYVPELPKEASSLDALKESALAFYAEHNADTAAAAEATVLKDGTVRIDVKDADGKLLTVYTVDPVTTIGTDRCGRVMQFTTPDLPAESIDKDTLIKWAKRDFREKHGNMPDSTEFVISPDGSVTIQFVREKGGHTMIDDVYTIDPVTGKGVDKNGTEVDLPQTGNNAPAAARTAAASIFLVIAGLFAAFRSGVLRRKSK
jgi:subtilisin family serine protease